MLNRLCLVAIVLSLGISAALACIDNDGDGYGIPGDVSCAGGLWPDCNDANAAIHPDAVELCDGVDNDCDGGIDDGPVLTLDGNQFGREFGIAVYEVGDVNGDGFGDVALNEMIYLGSAAGLTTTPAWSNPSFDKTKRAGDVNGDGFDDVISGDRTDSARDGHVEVYLGSASGVAATPSWSVQEIASAANWFGAEFASAGDVNGDGYDDVIASAPYYGILSSEQDEGKVYLYLGSASGVATVPAWTAQGEQQYARFGTSVAGAGDVNGDGFDDVVVGAPGYDDAGNSLADRGRSYLYLGSAAGLAVTPSWIAEGDHDIDQFGQSVAGAGDVNGDGFDDVLVGALTYTGTELAEGRASLYFGTATGLASSPAWSVAGHQEYALLGRSIGSAGDVNGDGFGDVFVGSEEYDDGETDEGAAFLYLGSASGLATVPAWTAEGDQPSVRFGFSVSATDLDGDGFSDLLVGAPYFGDDQPYEGRVSIYTGSPTGPFVFPPTTCGVGACQRTVDSCVLGVPQTCTPGTPTAESCNGIDDDCDGTVDGFVTTCGVGGCGATGVCTDGVDSCVPGEPVAEVCNNVDDDCDGNVDSITTTCGVGACVSTGECLNGIDSCTPGTPSVEACNEIDDDCDGTIDGFATSCGVGACAATGTCNGGVDSCTPGAPSLETCNGVDDDCDGAADNATAVFAWAAEGDQAGANLGASVASAGDVNGDGYDDVIVGAPFTTDGEVNEGRALVYLGSASGLATSPAWAVEGGHDIAYMGYSVSGAGDVNGDGYDDVIVGAPYDSNGESFEGRAFVYLGSASGLATSPAWTAEGDQEFASFGVSVASAGDVDGDGFGDVIVGAYAYTNGEGGEGRALVYLGSASGLATSPAWTAESNQESASFGISVASAGDVDGDGFGDVIVGAPSYDDSQPDVGRAYLYRGSASGLGTSPAWTAAGTQASSAFGQSVASAGDVNGDGFGDVVIGAPNHANGEAYEGRAFVYLGSASGLALSPAWTAEGNQAYATFGLSVASAGDVNGDGYGDVFVGAYTHDHGENDEGSASLYLGSSTGLAATPAWIAEGNRENAYLGYSVASAGDVDGDGFGDLIAGAIGYDDGEAGEGWAFLYRGAAGIGTFGRTTCGVGACETTVANCVAGAPQSCTPGMPSLETCNGIDDDCDGAIDNAPVPAGSPSLLATRLGNDTQLAWTASPGASSYDVVRGDLATLRSTGGNFTAAVNACAFNDLAATSLTVTGAPAVGAGWFYVVRGNNCAGHGSYDSGAPSQLGSRDAEIQASASSCP